MSKAQLRVVEKNDPHARDIARQRVKEWRSNAERQQLPIVNIRDDKGAPVLDVDSALKWNPQHIGRK